MSSIMATNMSMASGFARTELEPRISPSGFTSGIFTVLGLSISTMIARVVLRLQRTKRLDVDDYVLLAALVLLIAGVAVQQHYRDISYMVLNVELGNVIPDQDFEQVSLTETKVLDASSVLLWTSIFCVKFSFLFFFRKLIRRVRPLQLYWWVVVGFVAPISQVCIWLGFIECTHFGADFFEYCPADKLIAREHIYLNTTVVLDIFTDVLIVSLPVVLLWNVKIDLAKKLTLLSVFGLNIVMVVIALIRVTLAPLTPRIIDTTWLFFWQILEASIALIMVSISAFRGLFGQAGRHSGYANGRNQPKAPNSNGDARANIRNRMHDSPNDSRSPRALAKFSDLRSIKGLDVIKKSTITTSTNRSQSPSNNERSIEMDSIAFAQSTHSENGQGELQTELSNERVGASDHGEIAPRPSEEHERSRGSSRWTHSWRRNDSQNAVLMTTESDVTRPEELV